MLLNFQLQFAPHVRDGSKTHTIRGRAATPGEILHCFTGLRTKAAAELGRWTCTKSEPVRIWISIRVFRLLHIAIDGEQLTESEISHFAYCDGFRGPDPQEELLAFWEKHNRLAPDNPYAGFVNHWNFEERWERTDARRGGFEQGDEWSMHAPSAGRYKWKSNTGLWR